MNFWPFGLTTGARTLLLSLVTVFSATASAAPIKVAFVGDQGVGEHAQAVLSLIASEETDLLLIQGDLGYEDNSAALWDVNLDNALGADFPVLTVVGNHENHEWPIYQKLIQQRVDRVDSLSCSGQIGVKAACRFANIDIVQVAPGIRGVEGVSPDANYAQFIDSSFSDSGSRWRICSWHMNQEALQTGAKRNATGWEVYDSCLNAGAMIALAHEHAYSRTHLLSDFENQTIVHKNSSMTLQPGQSFAFVSGLGGWQVRPQLRGGDWWASIYTATQGATHGALFCSFEDTTAECYFKAIDGAVPDQFSLKLITNPGTDSEPAIANNTDGQPVQNINVTPTAATPTDESGILPVPEMLAETDQELIDTASISPPPIYEISLSATATVQEIPNTDSITSVQETINTDSMLSPLAPNSEVAAVETLQGTAIGAGSLSWPLLGFLICVQLRKYVQTSRGNMS